MSLSKVKLEKFDPDPTKIYLLAGMAVVHVCFCLGNQKINKLRI